MVASSAQGTGWVPYGWTAKISLHPELENVGMEQLTRWQIGVYKAAPAVGDGAAVLFCLPVPGQLRALQGSGTFTFPPPEAL